MVVRLNLILHKKDFRFIFRLRCADINKREQVKGNVNLFFIFTTYQNAKYDKRLSLCLVLLNDCDYTNN